jgi:hypothetical protein
MKNKTKSKTVILGYVGVDSGQLIICDPSYIEREFKKAEPVNRSNHSIYKHKDGTLWQFVYMNGETTNSTVKPFTGTYADIIPLYGYSPNEMIASGDMVKTNIDPYSHIEDGEFSYDGICKVTLSDNMGGSLNFDLGHEGAAVAFRSGYGDGSYPVYAEIVENHIKKVWVEFF